MGTISKEFFDTGKCFLNASTSASKGEPSAVPSRHFSTFSNVILFSVPSSAAATAPMKKVVEPKLPPKTIKQLPAGPKHDPTAPNALIMPRPTDQYQKTFNKA